MAKQTTQKAQESAKSPAAKAAEATPIASAKATVKSVNDVLLNAIEKGTLACVPGKDGMADAAAPKNAASGKGYDHLNALLLKSFAKENGFEENFLTISQLGKLSNLHPDTPQVLIKKGEHGQVVTWARPYTDKEGVLKFGQRHEVLFSVSQTTNPEKVREWSQEEKALRYEEARTNAAIKGRVWHNAKPEAEKPAVETITASSSDPAVYLGEYYRAMEKGKAFAAPKEIADQFVEKFKAVLSPDHAPGQGLSPVNAAAVKHSAAIGQALSAAYKQEHKADFQKAAQDRELAKRQKRLDRLEQKKAKLQKRDSYEMSM